MVYQKRKTILPYVISIITNILMTLFSWFIIINFIVINGIMFSVPVDVEISSLSLIGIVIFFVLLINLILSTIFNKKFDYNKVLWWMIVLVLSLTPYILFLVYAYKVFVC